MPPTFEKAPGHDWTILYLDGEDQAVQSMGVYGAMTVDEATKEARFSLGASPTGVENTDYVILAVQRDDLATLPRAAV